VTLKNANFQKYKADHTVPRSVAKAGSAKAEEDYKFRANIHYSDYTQMLPEYGISMHIQLLVMHPVTKILRTSLPTGTHHCLVIPAAPKVWSKSYSPRRDKVIVFL